jgi:hypothetical protein
VSFNHAKIVDLYKASMASVLTSTTASNHQPANSSAVTSQPALALRQDTMRRLPARGNIAVVGEDHPATVTSRASIATFCRAQAAVPASTMTTVATFTEAVHAVGIITKRDNASSAEQRDTATKPPTPTVPPVSGAFQTVPAVASITPVTAPTVSKDSVAASTSTGNVASKVDHHISTRPSISPFSTLAWKILKPSSFSTLTAISAAGFDMNPMSSIPFG